MTKAAKTTTETRNEERRRLRVLYGVVCIVLAPVSVFVLEPWGVGGLLAALLVVDGVLTMVRRT
jgi:hypothetical protein